MGSTRTETRATGHSLSHSPQTRPHWRQSTRSPRLASPRLPHAQDTRTHTHITPTPRLPHAKYTRTHVHTTPTPSPTTTARMAWLGASMLIECTLVGVMMLGIAWPVGFVFAMS